MRDTVVGLCLEGGEYPYERHPGRSIFRGGVEHPYERHPSRSIFRGGITPLLEKP